MTEAASTGDKNAPPLGVIALVLLLLAGFVILPRIFSPRESALQGKDAPDFTLSYLANGDGQTTLKMSDLRGKAVVLDFWASWCGPCQAEAPIVNKVAKRFRDRGVVVVGVNTSDEESAARAFATSRDLSFPIVFDATRSTASAYGVSSLPTLVIVSRTGKVLAFRTGPVDDAELEHLLAQAL